MTDDVKISVPADAPEACGNESAGPVFIATRRFAASRDSLWKALTEPERMAQWFGPKGIPVFASQMDFRPGGFYHYGLRTPDGGAMWGLFDYREIEPPMRIVSIDSFSDENRGLTRHPLSETWPPKLETIFYLADVENGGSELTLHARPFEASEEEIATFAGALGSMENGWIGTFDQLEAYLARQ
jgi:uncharacterized protein YndB with AHSA1/START domain